MQTYSTSDHSDSPTEHADMFAKLTFLEEQVAGLRQELALDKETIEKLQVMLQDKQKVIDDLELALIKTKKTILAATISNLQHIREKLNSGTDIAIVKPLFDKVNKQVTEIKPLLSSAKQLMDEYVIKIDEAFKTTKAYLLQFPETTWQKINAAYATILETQIKNWIESVNHTTQKIKALSQSATADTIKSGYSSLQVLAKEKTTRIQLAIEDKLITSPKESVSEFLEDIYFLMTEFFKETIYQIRKFFKLLIENVKHSVTDSQTFQALDNKLRSIRYDEDKALIA